LSSCFWVGGEEFSYLFLINIMIYFNVSFIILFCFKLSEMKIYPAYPKDFVEHFNKTILNNFIPSFQANLNSNFDYNIV
jgi:hypothetical protein